MKFRKTAFSLAELLITLLLIGVVASLTIPTVREHSDEIKYISAARKAASMINAATTAVEAKNCEIKYWYIAGQEKSKATLLKWYADSLNTIPTMHGESWEVINVDGNKSMTITADIVTADGMSLYLTNSGAETFNAGNSAPFTHWIIDTNSKNDPNVFGVDVHLFKLEPSKYNNSYVVTPYNDDSGSSITGNWHTAYVIEKGKMPWLKDFK